MDEPGNDEMMALTMMISLPPPAPTATPLLTPTTTIRQLNIWWQTLHPAHLATVAEGETNVQVSLLALRLVGNDADAAIGSHLTEKVRALWEGPLRRVTLMEDLDARTYATKAAEDEDVAAANVVDAKGDAGDSNRDGHVTAASDVLTSQTPLVRTRSRREPSAQRTTTRRLTQTRTTSAPALALDQVRPSQLLARAPFGAPFGQGAAYHPQYQARVNRPSLPLHGWAERERR